MTTFNSNYDIKLVVGTQAVLKLTKIQAKALGGHLTRLGNLPDSMLAEGESLVPPSQVVYERNARKRRLEVIPAL